MTVRSDLHRISFLGLCWLTSVGCLGGPVGDPERVALELGCPGPSPDGRGLSPAACVELGLGLARGRWGPPDDRAARQRFLWGCDTGAADACLNVAIFERDGRGGATAPEAAAFHFAVACRGGNGDGCVASHSIVADTSLLDHGCAGGHGPSCGELGAARIEDDPEAAYLAWVRGCEAGHSESCYSQAVSLARGRGIASDVPEAIRRFERLCTAEHARACTYAAKLAAEPPSY